jgi:hypothetical protein
VRVDQGKPRVSEKPVERSALSVGTEDDLTERAVWIAAHWEEVYTKEKSATEQRSKSAEGQASPRGAGEQGSKSAIEMGEMCSGAGVKGSRLAWIERIVRLVGVIRFRCVVISLYEAYTITCVTANIAFGSCDVIGRNDRYHSPRWKVSSRHAIIREPYHMDAILNSTSRRPGSSLVRSVGPSACFLAFRTCISRFIDPRNRG